MKNLFLDNLIRDWAWRVNDGCPDPKNRNHLGLLEDTLRDLKYNEDFILSYMQQLTEAEVFKARSTKGDKQIVVFKSKENMKKAIEDGNAEPIEKDDSKPDQEQEIDPQALSAKGGDFERKADNTTDKTADIKKDSKNTDQTKTISNLNKIQNELAEDRNIGIAGAGGAKASQGESIYVSSVKTALTNTASDEERNTLRNRSRYPNKAEKIILEDLGLDAASDEAADYLISREKYAQAELEKIKNYKLSPRQEKRKQLLESKEKLNKKEKVELKKLSTNVFESKSGFGGNEKDYLEWAKVAFDGGIATRELLDKSRMNTSKPYEAVQSTAEIDDSVESKIKSLRDNSEPGSDDYKYYDKELKSFKKFRTYHDTYVVGEDNQGRMFTVHITNKKASDLSDPHFNTTVANRFRSLKNNEDPESENLIKILENAIDKTTNFKQSTVSSVSNINIDDNFVKLAEVAVSKRLEEITERGLKNNSKLNKWLNDSNITSDTWQKMDTKTRLQSVQKFTADMEWHKANGNVNTDEDGNSYPKIAYDPFGRIFVKVGEEAKLKKHAELVNSSTGLQKVLKIKQEESDVVSIQHKAVVEGIEKADKAKGYPKTDADGIVVENGPHTQKYIERVMADIHFTTYIDMEEEDDDKVIAQMGIKGAKPSHIRKCLAEQSGYPGDPSDKEALKSYIVNTAQISEDRKFITIGKNKNELIKDEYRLAAPGTKAVSYFGKAIKNCVSKTVAASRSQK